MTRGKAGFKWAISNSASPRKAIVKGRKMIRDRAFFLPITIGRDLTPAAESPSTSETSPRRRVTSENRPKKTAEKITGKSKLFATIPPHRLQITAPGIDTRIFKGKRLFALMAGWE